MTPEQRDKLKRLRDEPAYYIPRCLHIRTKDAQIVRFNPNNAQMRLDATVSRLRQEGKPVRIIILKARQMGFSTYTEGLIFHDTSMHKNISSKIVAHLDEAARNIFNMSKLFLDMLPRAVKPMTKNVNERAIVFENPSKDAAEREQNPGLRSKITIQSAESLSAGRGETIHNLHASEVAFWRDGETLMTGLMQTVPNTPNTMVILESTANGVGGYFYDMWQKAVRGENDFAPLFFAWFEEPTYRMKVPVGFELTDKERRLKETYNLDDEQLAWRRWAIANNCNGDESLFDQEYPDCPESAFITSGNVVFKTGMDKLKEWALVCKEPIEQDGPLTIWKQPVSGRAYVIGADVAEGLATGDYSAATVWDAKTWEEVARWHGHIDPDLFADVLCGIGVRYNSALIAPEVNNHGNTVVSALKRNNYPNLYMRERYDKLTDETTRLVGFRTDPKTKPLIIDNMAKCIRDELIVTNDRMLISECMTYIREDDGSTNAQAGCHDDLVMASAIALFVLANYVHDYFPSIDKWYGGGSRDESHLPWQLRDDTNKDRYY